MQKSPVGPGKNHKLCFFYTLIFCIQSEAGTLPEWRKDSAGTRQGRHFRWLRLVTDVRGWMGSPFWAVRTHSAIQRALSALYLWLCSRCQTAVNTDSLTLGSLCPGCFEFRSVFVSCCESVHTCSQESSCICLSLQFLFKVNRKKKSVKSQ